MTVPVGVVAPVEDVSVTVTLQVEPWLITTGVVQVTVVVVGCVVGTAVMVTEYVTLWVWVDGVEVARVAVPVMVTEKVVVDETVPLKVTTSVNF